jgi:glycosyltransferase involved in cell wall biosynthesis
MNEVSLSIVLPCYNPLDGWLENIKQNVLLLKKEFISFEVIIVNDGSSKTFNQQQALAFFSQFPEVSILSYEKNEGKGYALRYGVERTNGALVIYTDIDFPYTHQSFIKIHNALAEQNADVAIGIRGEDYYTHLPKARTRISKLLRWFIKKFLRIPTDDTQCGLKGFNQRGKEIFMQTSINRYLFDLEFVFLSARKKAIIKTIEVQLRPEVTLSTMNWKILLQEGGNFLKIFLRSF